MVGISVLNKKRFLIIAVLGLSFSIPHPLKYHILPDVSIKSVIKSAPPAIVLESNQVANAVLVLLPLGK